MISVNLEDRDSRAAALFRRIGAGMWILVFLTVVGWLVYEGFGHRVIRLLFEHPSAPFGGKSLLNPDKSVEYYHRLGDQVVRGCVVYVLLLISVIRVAYGWILAPGKRSRLMMICGLWIVVAAYLINPDIRIVSVHGFIHTGIVYQILNGGLPPDNPLLAGQPLQYPWGFHVFAAATSRAFHISPAWSFALINWVSLVLCMVLIARITCCLIRDTAAQIYTVTVSLFMTTLMSRPLLDLISNRIGYPLEWRAIFAGQKFTKINGVPLGLVFFLLLIYSLIRLVQGHHCRRYALYLLVGAAGCGFVYPLMFPAVCASAGIVVLYLLWEGIRSRRFQWIRLSQVLIPLGASMALVIPYLNMITGHEIGPKVLYLNPSWFIRNALNVLFHLGPIAAVFFWGYRNLRSRWNPPAATVLCLVILACLGCYLGMHMFNEAEYKFLILLNVTVGILGGLAVSTLRTRLRPVGMLGLLLIFGAPVALDMAPMIYPYSWSRTPQFQERGIVMGLFDPVQDELYQWIRTAAPSNAIFMDTKLEIPYCGQRSLYLGWTGVEHPDQVGNGYNISMHDYLQLQSGYSPELLNFRREFLRQLYSSDQAISEVLRKEMRGFEPLFIVIRNPGLFPRFASDDFETVFTDSSGRVRVVRLRKP